MEVSLLTVFASEVFGTATLLAFGIGVAANLQLVKTYGAGGTTLMGAFGWGLGVFSGVYIASASGAHLNPAVTIGLLTSGAADYAPNVPVSLASTLTYFGGEMLGALIGTLLAWLIYRPQWNATPDAGLKLSAFATRPTMRNLPQNFLAEVIATFFLVFIILTQGAGGTPTGLGPLATALVVIGIGITMGGTTNWSLNPARDIAGRFMHMILPIKGKGSSDWVYEIVGAGGPIIGGILAGVAKIFW
ncbi:MAG: glycerol uptake facilitator protein [Subtercola sp.]|nr:glycerol uptake facilitator protein [Subtercola sp.]